MGKQELISIHDVERRCGISKPTIYRLMKIGDFPRPLKLSPNRVAWRSVDIAAWIDARPVSEGF